MHPATAQDLHVREEGEAEVSYVHESFNEVSLHVILNLICGCGCASASTSFFNHCWILNIVFRYLEQRDAEMHARVKQVIKECYDRNKAGDAAYKSLTHVMKPQLRATVGETYWKKAHAYLDHFFKKKHMKLLGVVQSAHDLFQKDSECPLCLEILVKSVSINPCGHSFCGECAETHLKTTTSSTAAAIADASSKKTECPSCKSKICGFIRNRALDTMIWAAALIGTFERGDAMNYLMRMEQVGERVATEEEKECILRRTGN